LLRAGAVDSARDMMALLAHQAFAAWSASRNVRCTEPGLLCYPVASVAGMGFKGRSPRSGIMAARPHTGDSRRRCLGSYP
jgi:hypothetical protein